MENDIDRLMARDAGPGPGSTGAPPAVSQTRAALAELGYAPKGAGLEGGGRVASSGGAVHAGGGTRIMAQWSSMRGVERSVSNALDQRRHSSLDVQAHVAAGVGRASAAPSRHHASTDAAGGGGKPGGRGRWRPSPVEGGRGTQDARVARAAKHVLAGLDLEPYNRTL